MAANLRFEASSSSPDGAQFMGGISNCHRSVDRSSSFRGEAHDSGGGGGRGSSGAAGQSGGDSLPLSQLLSLDPIPLGDQKYQKQVELKRVTTAIIEDPAQLRSIDTIGAEELKKVKLSISENSSRARDRSRYMSEAIGKLDRYRTSLLTKKRSKPESGNDRGPGASPPDRSATMKAPVASQPPEGVKPPEKSKGLVPNKRLRTSIADTRPNNPAVKKSADRESPRSTSVLPLPTEDKPRAPSEGLEKNKLKGRRSAIKVDQSSTPLAGNGVLEGDRDHKWTGQHRLSQEARPRINETHGLRSGPVHGVTSVHKAEALQMNGSASSQRSLCKGEEASEGDRFSGADKDRVPKNGLKPSLPEETHIPTVTKGKASRTPRSSMATHLSHLNRASASLTEKPQSSTKVQLPTGQAGNRKRPAPSSRSSSPVAQWGGQRPQKMARVARRVHVPPGGALPPGEDSPGSLAEPSLDSRAPPAAPPLGVRFGGGSNGVSGAPRRLQAGGVQFAGNLSKGRSERSVSSMVVSESEESEEASESKVKEKGKKQGQGEWEVARGVVSSQKGSLVAPVKGSGSSSSLVMKEEIRDGVRRQGRSGRNFCLPKPVVTTPVDKVDVATSTAKQLRSARTEKADRPGRTPSKKATGDRKSLTRIRRPPVGGTGADIGLLNSPGESDDDHEELLAAVRAAVDASGDACSSDFWKEMEPYFAFLTADDLSYLRQLGDSKWNSDVLSSPPPGDGLQKISNGSLEHEGGGDRSEIRSGGRSSGGGGWNDKIYPLSQRLLAALISEEDEALDGDGYPMMIPATTTGFQEQQQKFMADGSFYPNGNHSPFYEDAGDADDILADSRPDLQSSRGYDSSFCTNRSASTWENQDEQLSVDDRILLELRSIGLVVEQVPDLSQRDGDEICVQMSKLKEDLKDQVAVNRQRVATLEKSVVAKRETEMRERERLAVSKLVEFAYTRKKGWRGNSSVSKGAGNKGTKAAFLAFSKRALARVRRFEAGHSCIVDPGLRDILFCNLSKSSKASAGANSADTSVTPGVSETSAQKSAEHTGKLVLRRSDSKLEVSDHKSKDVSWAPWKEREGASSEDLTGATSTRNGVGFGGAKGKRSERDGKGQGKESHRKAENDRAPRHGGAVIKGERKTKTKPRAKAAPLFKDVNGLGKPAEVKEKIAAPQHQQHQQQHHQHQQHQQHHQQSSMMEVQSSSLGVSMEAGLDLTQLTIPEDLGVHDATQDIGAWLALDSLQESLQDQGELLMGLDVPMDDIADLGMMM